MEQNLTLIDRLEREIKCSVIAVFENSQNGHRYVAYTENSMDSESKKDVLVSICKETGDKIELEPIVDEDEWDYIDKFLEEEIFGEEDYE